MFGIVRLSLYSHSKFAGKSQYICKPLGIFSSVFSSVFSCSADYRQFYYRFEAGWLGHLSSNSPVLLARLSLFSLC
jgi:hypothetical protein